MFDESSVLSALKLVAAFSTVLFGVIGATTDTKTQDGRRTVWSNVALFGVLVSGGFGVTTQWLENDQNRRDAAEQQERAAQIIAQGQSEISALKTQDQKIGTVLDKSRDNLAKTSVVIRAAQSLQRGNVALQRKTTQALRNSDIQIAKSDQTLLAANALQRDSNTMLLGQARLLDPLTNVTMAFYIDVPIRDPALREYASRLESEITQWLHDRNSTVAYVEEADRNGRVLGVAFFPDSPLWPDRQSDPIAAAIIDGLGFIDVQVYKPAVGASQLNSDVLRAPDRVFVGDGSENPKNAELIYYPQSHNLVLNPQDLPVRSQYSNRNNKVISISDLKGSSIVVSLAAGISGKPETSARIEEEYRLEDVILNVDGQELWLRGSRMRSGVTKYESRPNKRWFLIDIPPNRDPVAYLSPSR